uniref:B-cell receptor CD22 n=1 Tax=Pygocentrus nattereri TaxID=42514 RepID=A0AAR2KHS2_PYGNA
MVTMMVSPGMILCASLVIQFMVLGVVAEGEWAVNYISKSVCALKGSEVTMSCTYTYPSDHSVQKAFWMNKLVTGGEGPNLSNDPEYRGRVQYLGDKQHNCTVLLRNLTEKDQSKYYFRFITDQPGGSWQGTGGVDLSVTDLQVEVPERVIEGDEVTLTCKTSFSLSDRPTFTWYRNGHPLSSSTDQLHLQLVSREDADRYRCAVLGLRSPEVTLNVRYGPKSVSVSISPSGEIVEGRSVTLTCSSDANPPVEYNWIKGTSSVGKGETYTMMEISSVDSGEYKCRSSNEHGEKLSEALTLNVLYPPKSVSVSISPSGETAEGSSVNLTCSSDANPPVQNYTWFKEGGSSPVGSGHSYRAPQRGSYYCEAQNEHGSQKSAAVTVKGVWNSALYAVIGVTAGCGCLSIIIAVFCVRRKRRGSSADDKNQTQNVDPNAKDDTNTALDPVSRTSDDVYNTLATVHSSPSDDLYSALDPQSRSPEYGTLATVRNKH